IIEDGGTIVRARRRIKCPGTASVVVSVVHLSKNPHTYIFSSVLDERIVTRISDYLVEGVMDTNPYHLSANEGPSFNGCFIYGNGFLCEGKEDGESSSLSILDELVRSDPRNAELIKPYVGGEEINTDPHHSHHRYVIDFDDMPLERSS